MSNGTYAEIEEIESVAEAIRTTAGGLEEAAAYAEEADPDMYMWGMVGLPLAYVYFEATPHIHDILKRMPGAVEGVAQRIADAASAISASDEEAKSDFDKLNDAESTG